MALSSRKSSVSSVPEGVESLDYSLFDKVEKQIGKLNTNKILPATTVNIAIPISFCFAHSLTLGEVDKLIAFTVYRISQKAKQTSANVAFKIKLYFHFKDPATKNSFSPLIDNIVNSNERKRYCEWMDIDTYRESVEWIATSRRLDDLRTNDKVFDKMFSEQISKDIADYKAWLSRLDEKTVGDIPSDDKSLTQYFRKIAVDMVAFLPATENTMSLYLYKQERFKFTSALAKYANVLNMHQSFHFIHYEADKLTKAEDERRETLKSRGPVCLSDVATLDSSAPSSPGGSPVHARRNTGSASSVDSVALPGEDSLANDSDTSVPGSTSSSASNSERGSDDEEGTDTITYSAITNIVAELAPADPHKAAQILMHYAMKCTNNPVNTPSDAKQISPRVTALGQQSFMPPPVVSTATAVDVARTGLSLRDEGAVSPSLAALQVN